MNIDIVGNGKESVNRAAASLGPRDREDWPRVGGVVNAELRTRIVRELYVAHHGRIVGFLRRLTTAERAEDFAQEVFFRLFQVKNLETRDITVSYLFRIGENLVRKAYHKDLRRRRANHELRYRSFVSEGSDSERGMGTGLGHSTEFRSITHEGLQHALECLTDREEAAVRLIVCRGLSYEEAASALGVNVTTINNWKHRGVKKLRTLLSNQSCPVRGSAGDRASESRDSRRSDGRKGQDQSSHPGGRGSDQRRGSGGQGELRDSFLRRA